MIFWIFLPHPHLLMLIRWLLAAVLLASAIVKIKQPRHFKSVILAYKILPQGLETPLSYFLPWLEAVIGTMLLLGWQTLATAKLSGLLMLVFIGAIGVNLARGRTNIDCGCFGALHHEKISAKVIGRDIILLLLSIPLALWGGGFLALDNLPPSAQQFILESILNGILLPLVLTGIGLYLLYRLARQLGQLIVLIPEEH